MPLMKTCLRKLSRTLKKKKKLQMLLQMQGSHVKLCKQFGTSLRQTFQSAFLYVVRIYKHFFNFLMEK